MFRTTQLRKPMAWLMLMAWLWSYAPGGLTAEPLLAAPSADPDEEIVYIDDAGVIRVLDTRVTGTNPEVKWFSPDGNWRAFALGDVNNDTDMEIIAIGGDSTNGRLAVFDPVVASGATDPNKKINGIPWDTLYETSLLGAPQLVVTGNFDHNLPGDEIMYLYEIRNEDKENPDDRLRLITLKSNSPTPTGRGWTQHFTLKFSEAWESMAVGNLDGRTTDEFGLVSEDSSNLKVFKVENGAARILEYGSSSRPPKGIAIGPWEGGARDYLAWTRGAEAPLGAFFVQEWDGNSTFNDRYSEAFNPSPRVVFFAQINNNSDAEVVLLRNVPSDVNSPRMIVRGRRQSDIPSELEQRLDDDNGYGAGAGGDVDGDGFDEIVLIRNNRILVFYEPDRSNRSNSYDLRTDRRNIEVGNLDAIGFISGPQFALDRSKVDAVLEAGGLSKTELITLTNSSTADQIPYVVSAIGNPTWLSVNPASLVTPSQIFLTFNSEGLQAGDYRTQLQITSPTVNVVNQPITVEVTLKVTAALVSLQPASLSFSVPCTDTAPSQTRVLHVDGTPGIRYTAAIMASPDIAAAQAALAGPLYNGYVSETGDLILRDDQGNEAAVAVNGDMVAASGVNAVWPSAYDWITAESNSSSIPDDIIVRATTLFSTTTTYAEALLVIVADSRAGAPPGNMRIVPLSNLCATNIIHLSIVRR